LFSFLLAAPSGTAVSGVVPVFVGSLLLFGFFHLFALVAGLLGAMLGAQDPRGLRRLAVVVTALFAALFFLWVQSGLTALDAVELYRRIERSTVFWAAMLPFRWYIEVALAKRLWPDLAQWSALCVLVNGLLFVTVHVLDARVEARAIEGDEGGGALEASRVASQRVRFGLPLWSRCRGLGPIAWRQSMNVVRRPQQIGGAVFVYGLAIFVLFVLVRSSTGIVFLPTLDGHREINPPGARICAMLAILLFMLVTSLLAFDFRSDMGQIDVLKALPIEPLVLTAGQLLLPVVVAALMQWLALLVMAIGLKGVPAELWAAAALVPPFSVVLMAIENLPTFWFPLRQRPGTKPEPFELFGHALVHPLLKLAGYGATMLATLVVSVCAYFVFGQHVLAALVAAWLTLAGCGSALVMLLAHEFNRFDVTRDVGG
jgi:hypothetical protein